MADNTLIWASLDMGYSKTLRTSEGFCLGRQALAVYRMTDRPKQPLEQPCHVEEMGAGR
jgi:hypothetical protein